MKDVVEVPIRLARPSEADAVVETLSLAFHRDPVWSWAFPDDALRHRQFTRFFSLMVHSTFEMGEVWVTPNVEVAANWFPPGASELTDEDEAALPGLLVELVGGAQTDLILDAFERFDAHRPTTRHWYLDFLGTHPDHVGQGLGMGLLATVLARLDETAETAYLESTNPANKARYARLGYLPADQFQVTDGGPSVTTMQREPTRSVGLADQAG